MSSQNYLGSFTEMEVAGEGRLEKQCRNLSMKKNRYYMDCGDCALNDIVLVD